MILRRLGNKKKIAAAIQQYFPRHSVYIEPFFGAGGMFFNKPKVKYNFLNDIDSDVFNLFQVVKNQKQEFIDLFHMMPIHNELFEYWKTHDETEPVKRAVRFIFLSNFSLYGMGNIMRLGTDHPKEIVFKRIDKAFDYMKDVYFTNCDFRKLFSSLALEGRDKSSLFVYCDPPYLDTNDNYSNSFTPQDASDLFDELMKLCQPGGGDFAYSEFDHPFILEQAKKRNLHVIEIGERHNIKNRRMEILVTNYKTTQPTLF